MKKVALTRKSMARNAAILLLISLVGLQTVEVAEANPFWIFHPIEPIPGRVSESSLSNDTSNALHRLERLHRLAGSGIDLWDSA